MDSISLSLNIPTLIMIMITLLITGVFSFLLGFVLGKNANMNGVYNIANKKNEHNNIINTNKSITIDEGKVVLGIQTDNLEKKYESLGEVKQSTESITSSINKLKGLKK